MRKFLFIIVAIALIAILGVTLLLSNLNSLVARVIEEEGSKVAATDVKVSGVEIAIREGRGTIGGLTIANPDGYAERHAFALGEATVDMDLESLTGEPIVIEEVRVRAPVVNAEILESGASNLLELQENVRRFAGSAGGGGDGDGAGDDAKRIRIERFLFEEGRIKLDASALGLEARELVLPSIRIDDIGGAEGALPDEIAQAVLDALVRKAAAEAAKAGVEQKAKDLIEDELEDKAKGLLDKIGG